jgi:hypothetical protein
MRLTIALIVLAFSASALHAAYSPKVVVWEQGEKYVTCQVLLTDNKTGDVRAYILDLAPDAKEEDAIAIATARLTDQLAGEAEVAKPFPPAVDWQAVALAIVAEVEAKDKAVKIDVQAAVEGKPAVTVTAVGEPIEEPIG